MLSLLTTLIVLGLLPLSCPATDVYLAPDAFIAQVFDNHPPKPKKLWIKGPIKKHIRSILGTGLGALRIKYWAENRRSAWILEAIGKDHPITAGFVVSGDQIERVTILIYRESRGWEIRYPFFTDQFLGARLNKRNDLTRGIDGISGATLSVHAITGLSRIALLLHKEVEKLQEQSR